MTMLTRTILLLTFLPMSLIPAQLIGSRGVIHLKEGYEYRDKHTVTASEAVAKYAKKYQPFADNEAERRKGRRFSANSVNFSSVESKTRAGQKLRNSEIFDFQSSRVISPLVELRHNKPLEEIELERSTSSLRLLPEDGQAVTKPSVARSEERHQEQESRFKETVRSQKTRKDQRITQPEASSKSYTQFTFKTQQKLNSSRHPTRSPNTAYTARSPTPYSIPSKQVARYSRYRHQPSIHTPHPYPGTRYYPSTVPGLLYSLVLTHLG